ncbi:MG2 domain-containing protein [Singulisphaera sp. PoT]|uniref:MG2 domain-containing protein n=1 Tax=Singulisphaera sp. PoT TaxID=3411797 RepID=UPI003BF617BC
MIFRSGRSLNRRSIFLAGLFTVMAWSVQGRGADPAPVLNPARDAVAHATPVLPAEVVAALQEQRFPDAEAKLAKLAEESKSPDDASYFALVKGIAQRLERKGDAARETLTAALKARPKGIWAGKLRFELATVELAAGHFAPAEELARVEAEALLAGDRKDRLAEVYHAFARKLIKPDDPITPADPQGAYDLLTLGRSLAKGEALRARMLLAMGKASQAAQNHPRAVQDYQSYIKEYPKGEDRAAARYHLGEAQLNMGQPLEARTTWSDLARELGAPKRTRTAAEDEYRARALRSIAATYGIPAPPDDTSLSLGTATLRRFIEAYPANAQAVRSSYEIGASLIARAKSQEALEAFKSFLKEEGFRLETEEARRDFSQLSMTATYQIAQILQGQQVFDEAIAAWKGYLAKFPNGPQSADAQRSILDTQLLIAADHVSHKRFAEARSAYQAFVAQNPLDGRVPLVLHQVGESYVTEKEPEKAIAAWEPLLSKFPVSEPAAHAQFQIAVIEEEVKGDPGAAIERLRKIGVEPWHSLAAQRIAVMESKTLTVVTTRTFRSGEKAKLKITSRNLEKLTFTAYKLDPEAYFRKKHVLDGVESLDISLVQPDAEWTTAVPGYAKYKPIEKEYDLESLKVPGVYVVKVTDEKTLQATTLVLGSDLDAIVKASREQVLVFAQDMKTGKGRANARVLICEGDKVILESKTGEDGVLLKPWDKPREGSSQLRYLVLDGGDVAGSGLGVPDKVAQGLTARAYIYTDRPAYRPGQEVALRGVVREVADGQYANPAGAAYRLEVSDSKGRQIVSRPVTLSAFGTFHETLPLDSGAPVGTYQVRVYQPGKSTFAGNFEVRSYQLESIDLAFDLKRTVFFRGETIRAEIVAKYQYGAPVANRPINVTLPDGRVEQAATNAEGKYAVEFSTEGFSEEQSLQIVAQLPQDNVAAVARVTLAVRAFSIDLDTNRSVYLDGEGFSLKASTSTAQGDPSGEALTVSVLKQVSQAGRVTEREVLRKELKTDAKTGKGSLDLKVEDEQGGSYILRASGTDRFGNPVIAERPLVISGTKDETRLRIFAERQAYKVGEEASVNLHSRGKAGPALVTWEADSIIRYRIVTLEEGNNSLAWAVEGAQFPNFTLNAARMTGTRFDHAQLDIRVERELKVTVTPTKGTVKPGEEVEVEVTTVDQLGKPVSAEIALALVDRSLLRLYGDRLPAIGSFFYDQTRTGAFATESTNTFHYVPTTTKVAEAVVEEAEQARALAANAESRLPALAELQGQVALNAPAPVPAPATAAGAPGMAGMGGMGDMQGKMGEMKRSGGRQAMFDTKSKDAAKPGRDRGVKEEDAIHNFQDVDASSIMDPELVANGITHPADFRKRTLERQSRSQPRQRFVETAYWNPSIVTDKEGKAKITFPAPASLSRFQFNARGASGADTLVGQSTAELVVRKDFFVDLKAPASLTQGDKPRFVAQLHHTGLVGKVTLKLVAYSGEKETVYPKEVEVKADGVDEVFFDAFEVPEAENVRLTLTAESGESKDELVAEVPIRPWGVQAMASASGASSDDATVMVGLPAGRSYESPEMLIVLSPTLKRMLIELALGQEFFPLNARVNTCIFPPPPSTTVDRASDLLAATQALRYLKAAGSAEPSEAHRLTSKIQGLVAELTSIQNDDGGWSWVIGRKAIGSQSATPSDRITSAHVVWALAAAEHGGLLADVNALERAGAYLGGEFAKLGGNDHDTRAVLLHALSTRRHATFEQANSLNRVRQNLSDSALAYLTLSLLNLDRATLAHEVADLLIGRAKTEQVGQGTPARIYWEGRSPIPFSRGAVEATAMATLAVSRARPEAPILPRAVDWLLAHRSGIGWAPHKAKGAALAALTTFYGKAQRAEDRYTLVVTVNDTKVAELDVAKAKEGQAILVPHKALKAGDKNKVRFDIEGRGNFGYAVTLSGFTRDFGPDQEPANRSALISRRAYFPAEPILDGKVLPTGFGVAVNAQGFENKATQVALGGKARIQIDAYRNIPSGQPAWERDSLVIEEHLPAGTTLIEGSVISSADSYSLEDGVLSFYFSPEQWPGTISYNVYGYLPGQYRALPPSIRSVYEPGRSHLGQEGGLKVLSPGEENTDPYKATPDELYARGKAHFDAGRFAEASASLTPLFGGYTLRDDIIQDAARMLLMINIKQYDARQVVQYFEVVKEKAPELVVSFDDLRVVGKAYRDIGEHERAALVWRGIVEASYLEDARVGETLRQRGKTLEAIAYLIGIWREYPSTASIEADFFGLSQVLGQRAAVATTDPATRQELAAAGVTRSELLAQAIMLVQSFIARNPTGPIADEASLALVGSFLELEDFESVVKLSARYAKLYPKSTFFDSFQYSEALGQFHLGQYDRAVELAEAIDKATYKDENGVDQPSPNKWQALYILGQIFDARRRPGQALGYYEKVADRFTDAAGAIRFYTRKDLKLPEVTVVRPESKPAVATGEKAEKVGGLRAIDPKDPKERPTAGVSLSYRNVAEADVKVYPVDLMRLYLTQRTLDRIAGIDLAGITPLLEKKITLGKGEDYEDKLKSIDLPLEKEGAYLVMIRGDDLYASGIVLSSPLELEVMEEAEAGRVRVTVRDARTKDPMPKVQVKVIGTDNPGFLSGQTDLRGVYVAEGVQGEVTAVARKNTAQYAFYRGKTRVGAVPLPEAPAPGGPGGAAPNAAPNQSLELDQNVKIQNSTNQLRQIERLQNRYNQGGQGGAAAKGFR